MTGIVTIIGITRVLIDRKRRPQVLNVRRRPGNTSIPTRIFRDTVNAGRGVRTNVRYAQAAAASVERARRLVSWCRDTDATVARARGPADGTGRAPPAGPLIGQMYRTKKIDSPKLIRSADAVAGRLSLAVRRRQRHGTDGTRRPEVPGPHAADDAGLFTVSAGARVLRERHSNTVRHLTDNIGKISNKKKICIYYFLFNLD